MLYLTENDRLIINNCYRNFLLSLKENLQSNSIKDSLECYAIIVKLLNAGRFSFNGKMKYSALFNYLDLPNMPREAQVMYGIACCRHINLLINDIMKTLGFNANLLYVKIDETDTWHKASLTTANHVVVTLKVDNDNYLLDAYNNFIFRIVGSNLEPVNLDNGDNFLMTKYPDDNIKNIGLVL